MKKTILLLTLALVSYFGAAGQYRAYHKEDLKKYQSKKIKKFKVHINPYSYGLRGKYRPQRFQGLQVISMNRAGRTHDDVYFIDKNGKTQYHTIKPTAPINRHPHRQGVYDSSNPSANQYQSFGQAVLDGVATMFAGMLSN